MVPVKKSKSDSKLHCMNVQKLKCRSSALSAGLFASSLNGTSWSKIWIQFKVLLSNFYF